jgi:hypothetical protein
MTPILEPSLSLGGAQPGGEQDVVQQQPADLHRGDEVLEGVKPGPSLRSPSTTIAVAGSALRRSSR